MRRLRTFWITSLVISLLALLLSDGALANERHEPVQDCRRLLTAFALFQNSLSLQSEYLWRTVSRETDDGTEEGIRIRTPSVRPVHGGGLLTSIGSYDDEPIIFVPQSRGRKIPTDYFWDLKGRTAAPQDGALSISVLEKYGSDFPGRSMCFPTYEDPFHDNRSNVERQPLIPTCSETSDGTRWLVIPQRRSKKESRFDLRVLTQTASRAFSITPATISKYLGAKSKTTELRIIDFKLLPVSSHLLIYCTLRSVDGWKGMVIDFDLNSKEVRHVSTLPKGTHLLYPVANGIVAGSFMPQDLRGGGQLDAQFFSLDLNGAVQSTPIRTDTSIDAFAIDSHGRFWTADGSTVSAKGLFSPLLDVPPFHVPNLDVVTQISPPSPEGVHLLVKGYRQNPNFLQTTLVLVSLSGGSPIAYSLGAETSPQSVARTSTTQIGTSEWVVLRWRPASVRAPSTRMDDRRLRDIDMHIGSWTTLDALHVSPAGIRRLGNEILELPFSPHYGGISNSGRTLFMAGLSHEQPQFEVMRISLEQDDDDDDDDDDDNSAPSSNSPTLSVH